MTPFSAPERYMQHPANTPLHLLAGPITPRAETPLPLGLICNHQYPLEIGTQVEITSPRLAPRMQGRGQVIWCRPLERAFQVGVAFASNEELYRVRMLEQLCHIEHYRRLLSGDGTWVSRERAAQEWIEKFAAHFPADGL